jgi:2-oxoglutarate-Fe(II)-dependent oxygenase superfamily protein
MAQLTHRGLVVHGAAEIDDLSSAFAQAHCVKLTNFLEPPLLDRVAGAIETATFIPRVHADLDPPATDMCLSDPAIRGTLLFLFNDSTLFEFVRRVSGCGPIGCFIGNTYRLSAEFAGADSWHDDMSDGRRVAISLNLSRECYRGGVLQIRDKQSEAIIHQVANTGFGDATLFRLAADIEHRVTDVLPGPARTAYAGWFKSVPSRTTLFLPGAARQS